MTSPSGSETVGESSCMLVGEPSFVEVQLYEDWLRESSESDDKCKIPNDSPWHSRSAVRQLAAHALRIAKSKVDSHVEVRLFTGSLTEFVYDDEWQHLMQQFVENNGALKVLFWNTLESCASIVTARRLLSHERCQVRCSDTTKLGDRLNHFLVVDDVAFRKESPHPVYPQGVFSALKPKISAQICFNDRNDASRLIEFFDTVWDKCRAVDLKTTASTNP